MQLQVQPNRWSCLPTAFAMVLDVPLQRLLELVGHEGGEIIWPELVEPKNRRHFHIQEMIEVAYSMNYAVIAFDALPAMSPSVQVPAYLLPPTELKWYMQNNEGVIVDHNHAVAWDTKQIFDPVGSTRSLESQLYIRTFYAVRKMK